MDMRTRTSAFAAATAAAAVLAVPATAAAPTKFGATLNGRSEAPKTSSKATGTATFTIAANGKSIRYTLNAKGLTGPPQAAHIHIGKPGQAGPVVVPLATKPFKLPRSGTLTSKNFTAAPGTSSFAAVIKDIRAGRAYVNIHTKKFPAGEIRGQIRRR